MHRDLVIKTSVNGIVLLKQNRLKKRYTGNKYSAVDINGNLWLKAAELKKHLAGGNKKPPAKAGGKSCLGAPTRTDQNYDNLSTTDKNLSPGSPKLSTERRYFIHKREVRQRILGYLNTIRGKKELYFWTVSFPEKTTDAVGYQMFNIWLTALRQYRMLKNYLWVAERQQNGTLHFHIAIPHKMPVKRANAMMQGTLKTFSGRGLIPFTVHQCRRYNGVDIAKNRKTRRVTNFAIKKGARALGQYLTKYVTKNDTGFTHLAWHNSRGYSSIFTGLAFTVPEFQSHGFHFALDRAKRFDNEYFTFIPWLSDPPPKITEHLYQLNSFIQSLLN
jgi:hypothetical protein